MSKKIYKKIFLDNLPKHKNGRIKWKESVEKKVHFIYDDVEDDLEIIDYHDEYLTIKYKDKTKVISTAHFKDCRIGELLNKKTNKFKIEIGTIIKDDKRDLTIIDREIRPYEQKYNNKTYFVYKKWYKYHCNIDSNEDWIDESHLLNGRGCNTCSNNNIVFGINTIYDTDKWMIGLGVSEEDAKKYCKGNKSKIIVTCPYCGKTKKCSIVDIYRNKSIGCMCGDDISYPNKFIYELCCQLLEQKHIKSFKTEYKIKNKRYDIYIVLNNGETLIIENHGEQHGKFIKNENLLLIKHTKGFRRRDEIKNDIYKCKLAYENGIDNYIQLDCSISEQIYIKNSIENSLLNYIFDLTEIDWNKCGEYALKNIAYEICKYWKEHNEVNNEDILIKDICCIFNINRNSIVGYLKQGAKIGWCNYDPYEQKVKSANRNRKHKNI